MPKDKVGVAVIGCGRVGSSHLDSIGKCADKAFIAATVDVDEARAKRASETFNTKYHTSVEAALGDPEINAMVICLSHDQHQPVAMEAMKAGKHVLVEKPIAISYTQAREMVNFSREKGLVLMSGVCLRHVIALQKLKKRMEAEIGNPFNLLYTQAEYFDKSVAPSWWQNAAKTGGLVLPMMGSHSIDQTLWFFEDKKPVRVYAEAQDATPPFEGYGEATVLIKFDDGAMATNYLSCRTQPMRHGGMVVGPKGSAHWVHNKGLAGLVGVPATDLYINGQLIMSGEQDPHNFAVQMDEFVSAILENRETWVKLDQILMGMKIIEAARKSIKTSQPVNI